MDDYSLGREKCRQILMQQKAVDAWSSYKSEDRGQGAADPSQEGQNSMYTASRGGTERPDRNKVPTKILPPAEPSNYSGNYSYNSLNAAYQHPYGANSGYPNPYAQQVHPAGPSQGYPPWSPHSGGQSAQHPGPYYNGPNYTTHLPPSGDRPPSQQQYHAQYGPGSPPGTNQTPNYSGYPTPHHSANMQQYAPRGYSPGSSIPSGAMGSQGPYSSPHAYDYGAYPPQQSSAPVESNAEIGRYLGSSGRVSGAPDCPHGFTHKSCPKCISERQRRQHASYRESRFSGS